MTIEFVNGDLLDALDNGDVFYIGHVTNCCGIMGSGIAKSIKDRYPQVYQHYSAMYNKASPKTELLGTCQGIGVGHGVIFNLHAQLNYGLDKRHLNYGALGEGLYKMSEDCYSEVVGFPFKMGSDRAGGDWSIVLEMLEFYFKDHNVKIYKL